MLLIRLIGCIFVTVCFAVLGIKKANALFKRVQTIDTFIKFINETAEEMRLSCDDIPEILEKVLPKGITLYDGEVLISRELCADDKEIQILKSFINGVGMFDGEAVWRRCTYYRQKLEEIRGEARENAIDKHKLYKTMGILTGLVLSFLWW